MSPREHPGVGSPGVEQGERPRVGLRKVPGVRPAMEPVVGSGVGAEEGPRYNPGVGPVMGGRVGLRKDLCWVLGVNRPFQRKSCQLWVGPPKF